MVQSRGPCCVLGRCAVPARTPGAGIGRKPHAAHADVHQATEPRHALVDVASDGDATAGGREAGFRSEEHTSELQSLMRLSYAVFCLKKKTYTITHYKTHDSRNHIRNYNGI